MPLTDLIVREFRSGLSMQEIADKYTMPLVQVERSIRRWMNLHVEVW